MYQAYIECATFAAHHKTKIENWNANYTDKYIKPLDEKEFSFEYENKMKYIIIRLANNFMIIFTKTTTETLHKVKKISNKNILLVIDGIITNKIASDFDTHIITGAAFRAAAKGSIFNSLRVSKITTDIEPQSLSIILFADPLIAWNLFQKKDIIELQDMQLNCVNISYRIVV
jgi:hypothetical protein